MLSLISVMVKLLLSSFIFLDLVENDRNLHFHLLEALHSDTLISS